MTPESIVKKIRKDGYVIIPNYWSPEKCELVKEQIDHSITRFSDRVWSDHIKADQRIFGFNRISKEATQLLKDPQINKTFDLLTNSQNRVSFVMAGRLSHKHKNLGSGQGWHRDCSRSEQYKAILYISNVTKDNGPFQYIKKSNTKLHRLKMKLLYDFNWYQDRFSTHREENALKSQKSEIFKAEPGTLILANTSGIHRGMPIQNGSRYALTIYMWQSGLIPDHIKSLMI
ncbi:MAG: hypothetical protein CME64_03875 [Halobacteriovoraceae bacterium]|nr:hypothetical protein [Halobacteriovoraceae bacterium]|tara:strand:+ start:52629 stop:53318 length:690 start_codon:yes stop_codon:yes gene_type:complete